MHLLAFSKRKGLLLHQPRKQLSPDEDMRLREVSGNNSPPTPNSTPLHRTEMINNVVQDINEKNKVVWCTPRWIKK
jgi:hypothetical protein